ncbi:glutamine amidotransferase [Streptomyces luomodiensis]|uniref:Glutamine amidotransferase n=1 Tax=Streptomyces luomodiensis TaxID=3026192 RepID=A0ABY9VCK3_9ACTN|nr:glutamine amidotransferase [Streptomyces sp. SCA4-21]WNF01344.1 glutamine amidotransferase [Streptomyces sp. SCA4-21]
MPPIALAIRHLGFEDLGLLHPLLHDRGYDVRHLDVTTEGIDSDAITGADLLVVLGGPVGANDTDRYPVLHDELTALRARLATRRPTMGICLGAQLLARALGAAVAPGPATEIGYAPLALTPDGMTSALRHLADVPVLHWHNDCFELPVGARHLASTTRCPHQAFAVGAHVLGLQFHLEADHRDIEHWLMGHAEALLAADIDPRTLRRDAAAVGPKLSRQAADAVTEWLDEAGC